MHAKENNLYFKDNQAPKNWWKLKGNLQNPEQLGDY